MAEGSAPPLELKVKTGRTDAAPAVSIGSVRADIPEATSGDQLISDFAKEKGDNRRGEILAKLRDSGAPLAAIDTKAVAGEAISHERTAEKVADAADQAPRDGKLNQMERDNANATLADMDALNKRNAPDGGIHGMVPAMLEGTTSLSPEIASDTLLSRTVSGIYSTARIENISAFVDKPNLEADIDGKLGGIRDVATDIAGGNGKIDREPALGREKSEFDVARSAYDRNEAAYREDVKADWRGEKADQLQNDVDKIRDELREKAEYKDADGKAFDGANPGSTAVAERTEEEVRAK